MSLSLLDASAEPELGGRRTIHAPGDELRSTNGPNAVRIRARYVRGDDIAAR